MTIEIKSLASSSAGNCCSISDGVTPLLIECGIPVSRIKRGLNFRLRDYRACLLTHGHLDHCRAARDLIELGVEVWGPEPALSAAGVLWPPHHNSAICVAPESEFRIGTWRIRAFACVHDFPLTVGYFMASGDARVLYLTDSAWSPHRFAGLTHVLLGVNYSRELAAQAVENGSTHPGQYSRTARNHMSLERALKMLAENDLSRVQAIHLLHLSDRHSDAADFKRQVAEATGKYVEVAER